MVWGNQHHKHIYVACSPLDSNETNLSHYIGYIIQGQTREINKQKIIKGVHSPRLNIPVLTE